MANGLPSVGRNSQFLLLDIDALGASRLSKDLPSDFSFEWSPITGSPRMADTHFQPTPVALEDMSASPLHKGPVDFTFPHSEVGMASHMASFPMTTAYEAIHTTTSDFDGNREGLRALSPASPETFGANFDTPFVHTPGFSANTAVVTHSDTFAPYIAQGGNAEPDEVTVTGPSSGSFTSEAQAAAGAPAGILDVVPFLVGGENSMATVDGAGITNTAMDVATLADGRQVQVWSEAGAPGSSGDQLSFRFFQNGAPVGAPIPVAGTSAAEVSALSEAQIAVLDNGNFVVVWSDDTGVEAQIFLASGGAAGTKFQIEANSTIPGVTTHQALMPSVTSLSNGGFAITCETRDTNADNVRTDGALGSTWDATGKMTGTLSIPGVVAQFTDFAKNPTPQVGVVDIGNGNVLVTWLDRVTDNLVGRIESYDGALVKQFVIQSDVFHSLSNYRDPSSGHVSLDDDTDLHNWSVSPARLTNGNMVVAWTEDVHPHYAIISPDGTVLMVRQLAAEDDNSSPTIGSDSANSVDVAALADGRFVLAWTNDDPEGFLPDGTVQTAPFTLNDGFIKARIFNADGSIDSSTTDFIVNTSTVGLTDGTNLPEVIAPHIAGTDAHGFIINWTGRDPGSTDSHAVSQSFEYPVAYPYGTRELDHVYYSDPTATSAAAQFMTNTVPVNDRSPFKIAYYIAGGGVSDSGSMHLSSTASNPVVTSVVTASDILRNAFQLDTRVGHAGEWTFNVSASDLAAQAHGWSGDVTVTVAVEDGNGGLPVQTEHFTVTNNTAPGFLSAAVNDVVQSTGSAISLSGTIQGFDADSDAITYSDELVETITGSLAASLSSEQKIHIKDGFQFTIDGNWTYTLSAADAPVLLHGQSLSLTVPVAVMDDFFAYTVQKEVITFIGPDTAAAAHNDSYTVAAGGKLTIAASGLLGNDTDAESDPLSAKLVTGPAHGILTLNANGSFVYAPDLGFTGTDSFQYRAQDGFLDGSIATVSLVVEPNKAPVITSDGGGSVATKPVHENARAVTTVAATDANASDTLTYSIVLPNGSNGAGADGNLFILDPATHLLSFKSDPDFEAPTDAGGDNVYEVTVRVTDGHGGNDTQTIAVTVTNVLSEHGDATANVFSGTSANDTYDGRAGGDLIKGNGGRDVLLGGDGNDTIKGGDANDSLTGGAGNDHIDGGAGNDRAFFDGTAAALVDLSLTAAQATGYGNDTLVRIENLTSGSGSDRLTGNTLGNSLISGQGNDTLGGGDGNDTLNGGAGDDKLTGGAGNDRIDGGAGNDRVFFTGTAAATVNLSSGVAQATGYGSDTLIRIENLTSGSGNDRLIGNNQSNSLISGQGNDTLNGGSGNDSLSGGSGADTFVFNTALSAGNVDRITDFKVIDDTIRLENAIFIGLATGVLGGDAFRANTTGIAADATDRIIYETDTGNLYFDADGKGGVARTLVAVLNAGLHMTNADFVVF